MELDFSKIDWKEEASKREKLYFALLLVMVVFMFARVFWIPKAQAIREEKARIKGVKTQIVELKRFIDEKLKEKIMGERAAERPLGVGGQLEKLLGKSRDKAIAASSLVDALTIPSSRRGLNLISMNFGKEVGKNGFYILPMELTVEGSFRSLYKYIGQVELFPQLVTVDNIDIKTGARGRAEVLAKLNFSLYIMGKPPQTHKERLIMPEGGG